MKTLKITSERGLVLQHLEAFMNLAANASLCIFGNQYIMRRVMKSTLCKECTILGYFNVKLFELFDVTFNKFLLTLCEYDAVEIWYLFLFLETSFINGYNNKFSVKFFYVYFNIWVTQWWFCLFRFCFVFKFLFYFILVFINGPFNNISQVIF